MSAIEKTVEESVTRTALSGKNLVITGVTGYLGKVILEKILRAIPSVGSVTLLIRGNRKYPTATGRFNAEVLTSSIFDFLKEKDSVGFKALLENKVRCIHGEITQPRFGLSEQDYQALASQTDVVINSAASVNFREALDTALTINARCLNQLVEFSETAGDIPVVQISTCYVNGYNTGAIAEGVSAPTSGKIARSSDGYFDIDALFNALDEKIHALKQQVSDPEAQAEALTELGQAQAHVYGWGDTYTFTKWLGEQLLLKRLKGKSLTIVRPSVIESCLQEPAPGWIEGVKVTDAILLAYARSKVSLFPARKKGIVDIIPADLVANAVIISTAEALTSPAASRIYQSCSGTQKPLGVEYYVSTVCGEVKENWEKYPKLTTRAPQKTFTLVNKHLFIGLIQAMRLACTLSDRLQLRTANNKSKALKKVESTLKLTKIYSTYTSPNYIFGSQELMGLAERMGPADKALFPVDAAIIDWHKYLTEIHVAGLNKYGMEDRAKEPEQGELENTESLPETTLASAGAGQS